VIGNLPSVVYGGPGGGISFTPGGGLNPQNPGQIGSGPGGIQTPADMTRTSSPPNVLTPPTQNRTVTPGTMTAGGTGVPNQGSGIVNNYYTSGAGGGTGGGTGGPDPFAGFTLPQWLKDDWVYIAAALVGVMLLPSIMGALKGRG
jgi:hypothetical protein